MNQFTGRCIYERNYVIYIINLPLNDRQPVGSYYRGVLCLITRRAGERAVGRGATSRAFVCLATRSGGRPLGGERMRVNSA